MRFLNHMLLVAVALLTLAAASSASATTMTPQNVAFSATSPDIVLALGSSLFTCSHSVMSGTTPFGSATTVSAPVSLSYSGCSAYGVPATVTVATSAGALCTGSNSLTLGVMYNSATSITSNLHIPNGCSITFHVPNLFCKAVIDGTQNIPGTVTNNPWVGHFNTAPVNVTGSGSCAGGAATLTATYAVTTPSNLLVEA